jgi:hypothetical protein
MWQADKKQPNEISWKKNEEKQIPRSIPLWSYSNWLATQELQPDYLSLLPCGVPRNSPCVVSN